MKRCSRNLALLLAVAVSVSLCVLGCGEPIRLEKAPSYADLVSIYSTELQSLDRLEQKREELIAKHEATLRPSADETAQALDAALSSANEAGKQMGLNGVTDPNELLDRAVQQAEKTQDLTSQLLKSASASTKPSEEQVKKQAELTQQFQHELAAIDKQIVEQKARVDRARETRDAAEAKQKNRLLPNRANKDK